MATTKATLTKATLNGQNVNISEIQELESQEAVLVVASKLLKLVKQLSAKYLERESLAKGMVIALLTGYNLFAGGEPGTAKTDMSKELIKALSGKKFYYLLGADTKPDELLGAPDLAALQNNEFKRDLTGKIADCHVAILDECFKCGSATLNTLLGLILDKQVPNGHQTVEVPLISTFGLSNELPDEDDDRIKAFWNRFPIRFWVNPVNARSRDTLRRRTANLAETPEITVSISLEELQLCQIEVKKIVCPVPILEQLEQLERALIDENIRQSDRVRVHQVIRILQAHALLHGRSEVSEEDLEILKNVYWNTLEDIPKVERVVSRVVNETLKELEELESAAEAAVQNLNSQSSNKTIYKFALNAANSQLCEMLTRLDTISQASNSKRAAAAKKIANRIKEIQEKEVLNKLAELNLA